MAGERRTAAATAEVARRTAAEAGVAARGVLPRGAAAAKVVLRPEAAAVDTPTVAEERRWVPRVRPGPPRAGPAASACRSWGT